MAYKTGAKGGNRNFGLIGAGKGCQDRTTDRAAFNSNFDLIPKEIAAYGTIVRRGNKKVYFYGKPDAGAPIIFLEDV